MKLCIQCANYRPDRKNADADECDRGLTALDPVRGRTVAVTKLCKVQRDSVASDACGPEAKFFVDRVESRERAA